MPKPIMRLKDLAKNPVYFIKPKHLQQVFSKYLTQAYQNKQTIRNKVTLEKLKQLKKEFLKKLKDLKITNAKKAIMLQQFNAALQEITLQSNISKTLKKSAKFKLMRLRKILMRQKMRLLKMRRKLEALEEFEDIMAMHKLQLERDYESFIKKLEKEKIKYTKQKSDQKPSEIADNLSENIIGLCEILSELLEIDKKRLLKKLEKNGISLKNDFLYLELILKSKIADLKEFDKKMLDIIDMLEAIYNTAQKEISNDDVEKNQILENWCKQIELNLCKWLNNEHIEKFDKKNKENAIRKLTLHAYKKPKNKGSANLFMSLNKTPTLIPSAPDLLPLDLHRYHSPHSKPRPPATTTK
jgi:hypothetical protein